MANTVPKAMTPVVAAPEPPPKRKTVINSRAVVDSVSHLPRSHLGSKLYTVSYQLPPRSLTAPVTYNASIVGTSDRFGYTMKPEPISKFDEDQANCTFTIRVPRTYLTSEKRDEICRRRFLWGTEVYTDDSDPIAAAMHSGWIRGEWSLPEGEDELLELVTTNGDDDTKRSRRQQGPEMEIPTLMTEPLPTGPVTPPRDMDAHITLLLLPPLQKYGAATRNGIRSREWGGNHDGLSYLIHRIEWAEEGRWGGSMMEERSGKARRERLQVLAMERKKVEEAIKMGKEKRRLELKRKRKLEELASGQEINGNAMDEVIEIGTGGRMEEVAA